VQAGEEIVAHAEAAADQGYMPASWWLAWQSHAGFAVGMPLPPTNVERGQRYLSRIEPAAQFPMDLAEVTRLLQDEHPDEWSLITYLSAWDELPGRAA
jgi:hypothetical protein